MKLKLVVTGTGRCGTVYMARWITLLGIPCGHESIYDFSDKEIIDKRLSGELEIELSYCSTHCALDNNISEWLDVSKIEADSSYMAAPYLNDIECPILHVVRNPLKVISSFCNIDYFVYPYPSNKYEEFIYKNVPELTDTKISQYERAALYYVRWNEMIEKHSDLTWPIEGDPNVVMNWLGVDGELFENKKINSFKIKKMKFHFNMIKNKMIFESLMEMSERYGYFLKDLM